MVDSRGRKGRAPFSPIFFYLRQKLCQIIGHEFHWLMHGGHQGRASPGSKFFHCHALFGKKNCKIIPIWDLAHPPLENPGSATEFSFFLFFRK